MNHKLKTTVFKILNILPEKFGTGLYHLLQNFTENRNLNNKVKSCESTFNTLQKILTDINFDLKGKSVIEIGSGWLPIMPYFIYYKGESKKVYTYDLNKHYQSNSIKEFNSYFEKNYNFKIEETKNNFNLPLSIQYHPKENVCNATLPEVEIIFSRFVLEHVTPSDLKRMHEHFKSSLPKNSLIVHFISPSDHRAYSDNNLSLQDFLKYSQEKWDSIQTRFDYHNRWRLPQYLNLFQSLDYTIEHLSYDNPENSSITFEKFKSLKIHQDFSMFSDEELTAGNIIVILKT